MKHTPEPWKYEDEYVRNEGGEIIADTLIDREDFETSKANGERIIACINNLAGIDDVRQFVIEHAMMRGALERIAGLREQFFIDEFDDGYQEAESIANAALEKVKTP